MAVVNMYNKGKAISGKNQIQPALDYLGITGKGNITNKVNQIITHLACSEDVVKPDTVALRCLKKWFVKPLKGTRIQGIFRKVMKQLIQHIAIVFNCQIDTLSSWHTRWSQFY